ncbi:polyisoprenoid diphosphate/phosphate phosphohydrolase PLPP6 [Parasteatoda tepidariorum]|uniref:polyisoprenoid diphosphate/phosphate phosphohydrolase PLPP6 n=1 Tax=Parasteatoda tepidariorum TaxID=114398 RepID=UPI00077F8349|nr:phospholipid phosphatase 6 [Parasteatoda tepidariorum]
MADKKYEDGMLGKLLELDKKISLSLSLSASKTSPLGNYRPHMKALEYSCHGVFWISGSIILLWLTEDPIKDAFFFNIILALLLDVLFVAVLKALLRRRRPENNESEDMFMTLSVDKMSCPSGHTSRAVLVTYLLIWCTPQKYVLHLFLLVWCICTCSSRILLGRHHVGDVLIGAVLGYVEYCIMNYLWAGPENAKWYLDLFRDSSSIVEDL